MLCEHHCTSPECGHDAGASAQEIRAVYAHIKNAVAVLRADLAQYAATRGVYVPATN